MSKTATQTVPDNRAEDDLYKTLVGIARLTARAQPWSAETKRTVHALAMQAIMKAEHTDDEG